MTWHRCLLLSLIYVYSPLQGTLYQTVYKYRTPLHITVLGLQWAAMFADPVLSIKRYIQQQETNKRVADADPAIRQFIIEKMNAHQVPTEGLQIKIRRHSENFACSEKTILIPEKYHDEFARLIIKDLNRRNFPSTCPALTAEESKILGYCSVVTYHEIAHYKYRHHLQDIIRKPLLALGMQGLVLLAMRQLKMPRIFSPYFLKNKKDITPLPIAYAFLFGTTCIASALYDELRDCLLILPGEREADAFAFQAANKQELEGYIAQKLHDPRHAIHGSTHPSLKERINKALDILASK